MIIIHLTMDTNALCRCALETAEQNFACTGSSGEILRGGIGTRGSVLINKYFLNFMSEHKL